MDLRILRVSALLGVVAVPAGAQLLFAPPVPTSYPPLTPMPRFAAGDVDGDGLADLVLGNAGAPGLRVGLGGGHFAAETPISVAAIGGTVALADMNGDGVLDLLVGSTLTGMFHVAIGAGDGSFAVLATYVIGAPVGGQNQLGLSTADADGDGDTDVMAVVAGQVVGPQGQARLYRNLGTGTLGLVTTVTSPFTKVAGAFAANLNGDNLPDMVVIYNAGFMFPELSASALLCQPDATFVSLWGSATELPALAADVDGDGDEDLLTVPESEPFGPPPGTIMVQLNTGNGSFVAGPVTPVASANGSFISGLPDLDADGRGDLLLTSAFPAELWMLRGAGDGSFQTPGVHVTLSNTDGAGDSRLADFDGDARPDVISTVGNSTAGPLHAVSLNRTYPEGGPLLDLGGALEGAEGWPIQIAEGSFRAGAPFAFSLSGVTPGGSAYHVVGLSLLNAPFKGGVMVPVPFLVTGPWVAGAGGAFTIGGAWPPGPAGLFLALQFWFPDAGGPAGFAASSAVAVTVP